MEKRKPTPAEMVQFVKSLEPVKTSSQGPTCRLNTGLVVELPTREMDPENWGGSLLEYIYLSLRALENDIINDIVLGRVQSDEQILFPIFGGGQPLWFGKGKGRQEDQTVVFTLYGAFH